MRYVKKYSTIRQGTEHNINWQMRIECWLIKATDTYSQCVIIIALPRQQWLGERASILCSYLRFLSWYVTLCQVFISKVILQSVSSHCSSSFRHFTFVLVPELRIGQGRFCNRLKRQSRFKREITTNKTQHNKYKVG